MRLTCYLLFLALFLCPLMLRAQQTWEASWVSLPGLEAHAYAVLHFRNSFELGQVPNRLPLFISADIRYKLYINGKYIGQGPANNDLRHYSYDELEVAPYLQKGSNTLAILVFSMGAQNPLRYESSGAKLIVQAGQPLGELLNTGSGNWRVHQSGAYTPTLRGKDFEIVSYYAMGGGEKIDGAQYTWQWQLPGFDDAGWAKAVPLFKGEPYGNPAGYGEASLGLHARSIPAMDESPEQRPVLRIVTPAKEKALARAWAANEPLTFPANTETTLLLDQTYLTKAHPFFTFSGGRGAEIRVGYAESLYLDAENKGNRDEIEGKKFIGLTDIYLPDGGRDREYTTLLPRVWRYLQLTVKTAGEPLSWSGYRATKFIYPFQEKGYFQSEQPLHRRIWEVGWRTARLCADETYMDCPYYEQLQYVGDTRIQALISLYVAGDDRLMRNAITQFVHSITDEGITQSRFPSSLLQYIPPYSLFWVNMLHDYHMHRNDDRFTARYLPQVASVLFWFENKLREDKLLGPLPWWSYADWVESWPRSSPPGSREGGSVLLSLQFVYALQDAIALFEYHGQTALAAHFRALKEQVQEAVRSKAYHPGKQLFADTPAKTDWSQHSNLLAILTNTAPEAQQAALFDRLATDASLTKTNIYFSFYLHRAAQKAGRGEYFIQNLGLWEAMIQEGLSTFAESAQNTRSDCHAWSASPNYDFLSLVCGIQPAAPHFEKISIAPNPGNLRSISGKMPHPKGEIILTLHLQKEKLSGEVSIPEGTQGNFVWKGKTLVLVPGKNKISF